MKLIFCSDPLSPRQPDTEYEREVAAAESLNLTHALIDYEALVSGDSVRATRRVSEQASPTLGLYRGWMLRPEHYQALYGALAERNIQLINNPVAYQHCHYLPEWYPALAAYTPKSVWLPIDKDAPQLPFDAIHQRLQSFGAAPIIVKDFVKSRKHEWAEACFIPSAADREAVERTVRRFMELQGDNFNAGLVFREFIEFEPLAIHAKSGMPLTQEYRIFYLDGEPIYIIRYWEEGDYPATPVPIEQFREAAQAVQSRFFTMDVAKQRSGDWMIVELGDGQVAGLPQNADVPQFYQALSNWQL